MDKKTSTQSYCPNCGHNNACQRSSVGAFSCWCQEVVLTENERKTIKAFGFSPECLCQTCISELCKPK